MDVEKCITKECVNYDKDDHNNCMTELDIKICPNHLISKTAPVAEVPCSDGLSDLVLRVKLMKAFMDGYEAGHNDTVESAYSDAEDRANDWLDEQEEEGR